MDIFFTDTVGILENYYPQPASKMIPEWYKKSPSSVELPSEDFIPGQTTNTIKKCMPVFDSMTAGYIIKTFVDIVVVNVEGHPFYQWRDETPILFHDSRQAEFHPVSNGSPLPKWNSPWSIKTPRGYSCLFIPPMHHPNEIFTVLPGIVDTDSFTAPINFPFVLNNKNWEGVIPAGTPMVQVLPFKRDSFSMKFGGKKQLEESNKSAKILKSLFYGSYKRQFWTKKSYK